MVRDPAGRTAVIPRSNSALARLILVETTLGTALAQVATAQAERHAAEQREQDRRDQERLRAAQPRRANDYTALSAAGLACVTVLVPYLLGHFLMRKTFVLDPDPRVYDDEARGLADHFWADYLGGVVVIGALLAVFLLARPREFRQREMIIGGIIAGATLILALPTAMSEWQSAENKTVTALRETAYPFDSRYLSYDSWSVDGQDATGLPEKWQIHLGNTKGTPRGSNRINIYRGWRDAGAYNLGGGDTFTGELTLTDAQIGKPYTTKSSGPIVSKINGVEQRMDPAGVSIELPTENGRTVVFTLAGGANGQFELR